MKELSSRQRQVVELVAEGISNKIIAHQIGIAENTVKAHVRAAMIIMGVINRTEIAAAVWRARAEELERRALTAERQLIHNATMSFVEEATNILRKANEELEQST